MVYHNGIINRQTKDKIKRTFETPYTKTYRRYEEEHARGYQFYSRTHDGKKEINVI